LAIGVAFAAGGAVIETVESFGQWLYPLPSNVDPLDIEAFGSFLMVAPRITFVPLILAWALASFVAGPIAARIAGYAPFVHGLAASTALMLQSLVIVMQISHPAWFIAIGLSPFWPFCLLGLKVFGTSG
jgi:hypothetical protein